MENIREYRKKTAIRRTIYFASVFVLLLGVFILSILSGTFEISVSDIFKSIFGRLPADSTESLIIMTTRLPRALAAVLGGAALAVSGLLLQTYFGNPIVESYVLGVSSGSSLFVGIILLVGFRLGFVVVSPWIFVIAAFLGAMLVMAIMLFAAGRVKNIVTLLVIGLMVGYISSAAISILVSYASKEGIAAFVNWGMGSFSGLQLKHVGVLSAFVIPMTLASHLLSKPLNALQMGDTYATSVGVNTRLIRVLIVLFSSLLTAAVTAFAGPVSFVGLAVPHMSRILLRTQDIRALVPACALGGAFMASVCDLIARMLIAPRELPLSAITAIIGAPVVVYLLRKVDRG